MTWSSSVYVWISSNIERWQLKTNNLLFFSPTGEKREWFKIKKVFSVRCCRYLRHKFINIQNDRGKKKQKKSCEKVEVSSSTLYFVLQVHHIAIVIITLLNNFPPKGLKWTEVLSWRTVNTVFVFLYSYPYCSKIDAPFHRLMWKLFSLLINIHIHVSNVSLMRLYLIINIAQYIGEYKFITGARNIHTSLSPSSI